MKQTWRKMPLGLVVMLLCLAMIGPNQSFAEDTILPSDEEDTGKASTDGAGKAAVETPAQTGVQDTATTQAAGAGQDNAGNAAKGLEQVFKGITEIFQKLVPILQNLFQMIMKFLTGINTVDNSVQDPNTGNTGGNDGGTTITQTNTGGTADTGTTNTGTTNTGSTVSNGATNTGTTGESAALNAWKGGKLAPAEFARLLGPVARESMKKTGVPASITLAQAALETGWGKSTIGSAKNLFGIKGTGPAGSVRVPTKEYINGRTVTIQANFRKYNTWQQSIDDHSRLLSQGARYKNCMKNKNNPDQFARELVKAGYATSPTYATQLISIMKKYNFYQYDK